MTLTRRATLALLPIGLAGCVQARPSIRLPAVDQPQPWRIASLMPALPRLGGDYGEIASEPFPIPAVDLSRIDPAVLRRRVRYDGREAPGTIVVDTPSRRLFLVEGGGSAMRYGVGVGREGLDWGGRAVIGRKAEWPRWIPTKDMIRREPQKYAKWAGGMDGGLENPLGARALYLHQNNRDTYYRIHGTNEPMSIGTSVSSGCIRMINQDVVDLYERVPVGAPVIVVQ